ncbi:MAG: Omp28-related outer membrane protein [Bacteroidales bacterium]|nr:Omp28-related outer membrane protein [Bacteroidales bacterium]
MKYFKISIVLTIILSIVIFSCDKIDAPYIIPEPPPPPDCPTPDFPDISDYEQVVLLEEFTGHTCSNCPEGTLFAHDLKEQYKEKLILISIHAGSYAIPIPDEPGFEIDLRTETGNLLLSDFNINSWPIALINRAEHKGFPLMQQFLPPVLDTMITSQPVIGMQLLTEYDDSERKLCIHIKNKYLKDLSNSLMLSVYITEDSIKGAQKNDNPDIGPDVLYPYWHMHVLRGSYENPWGFSVPGSPYKKDATHITTYKYILNENWKAKNCHVVAFIYDADTKVILQAVETKVIGEE